jgi:hypothetical protein
MTNTNNTLADTLNERGKRYGNFADQAAIAQAIKAAMYSACDSSKLAPDQREALAMIANKLGRILNGDPNYADSWMDIAGYAKLVADRLEAVSGEKSTTSNL